MVSDGDFTKAMMLDLVVSVDIKKIGESLEGKKIPRKCTSYK